MIDTSLRARLLFRSLLLLPFPRHCSFCARSLSSPACSALSGTQSLRRSTTLAQHSPCFFLFCFYFYSFVCSAALMPCGRSCSAFFGARPLRSSAFSGCALASLFHAQAALPLSCPGARHSPAIARLALSHHCAWRSPTICCSGAQASWRLAAGGLRSLVIGAPRRAAALWCSAAPGAQGSPAICRSGDQPPWRSAALGLSHSGAQVQLALIHAFTWPTAPRSHGVQTPLRVSAHSGPRLFRILAARDARSTELGRFGARPACLFFVCMHVHDCPRIHCCIFFYCVC